MEECEISHSQNLSEEVQHEKKLCIMCIISILKKATLKIIFHNGKGNYYILWQLC